MKIWGARQMKLCRPIEINMRGVGLKKEIIKMIDEKISRIMDINIEVQFSIEKIAKEKTFYKKIKIGTETIDSDKIIAKKSKLFIICR